MKHVIMRMLGAVQLTRLTMAFGAVADLCFIIVLTRADEQYAALPVAASMSLGGALTLAAVIAIGLFAYGAALNDVLDVRQDTTFSPQRPIPAGRIRAGQAVAVAIGALLIAILAVSAFGAPALRVTLLTATAILFYNTAGKFVPAIGVTTLGLIHASHMFIVNPQLVFTLPVWLVFTHTLVIAAMVHRLEDKRPRFRARSIAATVLAWLACSGLILGWSIWRGDGLWPWTPNWPGVVLLLVAIGALIAVARWKIAGAPGRIAAEKLRRYGAMWQCLYASAWLAALDLVTAAMWFCLAAVGGFIIMTALREATGLSRRPVAYRA